MKILIISNNAFSKSQNMGKTLDVIFSSFDSSEICQLYFYSSVPDASLCMNFYRVSDYDLIQGRLFGKTGQVVVPQEFDSPRLYDNEDVLKVYRTVNRDKPWFALARTLLWDIARWDTNELVSWINEMHPDCIFFASGDTVFTYKIAYKISQKYRLPIISYICDEFYFGYHRIGVLGKVYHNMLKKWMEKIYSQSCLLAVICDPLGKLYKAEFGVQYYVLNTGSTIQALRPAFAKKSSSISYLGNLSLNRWKSLVDIGKALNNFNLCHKEKFHLDVYSGETSPHILHELSLVNSIRFMGRITAQQCAERIQKSVAVIHTESFNEEDIKRVKYSMSTKIADSLGSGTCLFAYGSENIASIQYLIDNNCAVVATSKEELEKRLTQLLESEDLRKACVDRALKLAKNNHNAVIISSKFKTKLIQELFE